MSTRIASSNEKKGLQQYMDMLHKELNKDNAFTQYLAQAEAKTGVSRLHIVMAAAALFTLIFLLCFGGEFLMALISFVYPAYKLVLEIFSMSFARERFREIFQIISFALESVGTSKKLFRIVTLCLIFLELIGSFNRVTSVSVLSTALIKQDRQAAKTFNIPVIFPIGTIHHTC